MELDVERFQAGGAIVLRGVFRDWVEPGDAIAFAFRTVHGAPANRSTRRRRAFSSRWVGDDAVYVDRGGKTSPPFPDLNQFPLVFPR